MLLYAGAFQVFERKITMKTMKATGLILQKKFMTGVSITP